MYPDPIFGNKMQNKNLMLKKKMKKQENEALMLQRNDRIQITR